jgi:hypothetical protein
MQECAWEIFVVDDDSEVDTIWINPLADLISLSIADSSIHSIIFCLLGNGIKIPLGSSSLWHIGVGEKIPALVFRGQSWITPAQEWVHCAYRRFAKTLQGHRPFLMLKINFFYMKFPKFSLRPKFVWEWIILRGWNRLGKGSFDFRD